MKYFFFLFLIFGTIKSQNPSDYIRKFKEMAINEMYIYRIPASITLAQGILESASGMSKLATEANNHFGIKCHVNWNGQKAYHDDDEKQECFRKYDSVKDSYRDHSIFLSDRKRYSFLFDLRMDDYKGWAKGLQKAGYATSKTYSKKLIGLIKKYNLDSFDDLKKSNHLFVSNDKSNKNQKTEIYSDNFIKYVIVEQGQTISDIAEKYELWIWEILKYNECDIEVELIEGNRIYLQPKRKKSKQKTHLVKEGDSMYSISQAYGIKLKFLYRYNRMDAGTEPFIGQKLNLNKKIKFN
tara:strand:+ start:483 stop:1370 length:888 start_codon:yes stop_codon:yes gene_type:complete